MGALSVAFAAAAHAAESPAGKASEYPMIGPFALDSTFWTLVGLLIFLGIVWQAGGFKAITGVIDRRRDLVRAELAEAERLRNEAQALLNEYEAKRAAAEIEAREIVAQAKIDAETLRRTAKLELEADLARRDRITQERIARAELQATTEARQAAVTAAIETAERLLTQQMNPETQKRLAAEGVEELSQRFTAAS